MNGVMGKNTRKKIIQTLGSHVIKHLQHRFLQHLISEDTRKTSFFHLSWQPARPTVATFAPCPYRRHRCGGTLAPPVGFFGGNSTSLIRSDDLSALLRATS